MDANNEPLVYANDPRDGDCIMLLNDATAALAPTPNAGNPAAQSGYIWTMDLVDNTNENYDYQFWKFEANPDGEGYALICKAQPDGSLNSVPVAGNIANGSQHRWEYLAAEKDYNFTVTVSNGTVVITCDDCSQGLCSAGAGQGYAINAYNVPNDGAVHWTFVSLASIENPEPEPEPEPEPVLEPFEPTAGVWYRVQNCFNGGDAVRQGRFMAVSDAATPTLITVEGSSEIDDSQLWSFELGADGNYAIVNKKHPAGYLSIMNSTIGEANSEFVYNTEDDGAKEYGFIFPRISHDVEFAEGNEGSCISHVDFPEGWYFNTAGGGKNYRVNLWKNENHENAIVWEFVAQPAEENPDGPETGITDIMATPAKAGAYDLQGRKVANPRHGLYIINGVKTVVR